MHTDAVASAVGMQREMAERDAEMPPNRQMKFRIDINSGEAVVRDDALYGVGARS